MARRMPERSHIEEPVPVERVEIAALVAERDRYKAALEYIRDDVRILAAHEMSQIADASLRGQTLDSA
jgi:hypothetical protein